jgi:hypothetical protein
MTDARRDREHDEVGSYAHGRASFLAHAVAVTIVGVVAAFLIAGHRHAIGSSGYFWLLLGGYLLGGAFTPRLSFGPTSRQRWLAARARVRRGAPQFGDRLVIRFDPLGRAFNLLLGGGLVVYALLRILGLT